MHFYLYFILQYAAIKYRFFFSFSVIFGQQYFRVKPHDTSVVAGRTAELHCHIGNRAGLVQWSKDGFLLGKFYNFYFILLLFYTFIGHEMLHETTLETIE